MGTSTHTVTITDDELPSANISYSENFSDCSTHDWTVVTVGAETEWTCGSGYFEANAFGSSGTADDYLISPSFNMDTQTNEILSFNSLTQYAELVHKFHFCIQQTILEIHQLHLGKFFKSTWPGSILM